MNLERYQRRLEDLYARQRKARRQRLMVISMVSLSGLLLMGLLIFS